VTIVHEDEAFLTTQLITYIGNKRALLDFIGQGVQKVCHALNTDRLSIVDLFSGSGVVARYLKRYAHRLIVNDLEHYAYVINRCYLTNRSAVDVSALEEGFQALQRGLTEDKLKPGFITQLYSPQNAQAISEGERCFYTPRNARYIDTARQLIDQMPEPLQPFFLGPLLSEASVHANTAGVFKGFYKNSLTGKGQFGGNKSDALSRIMGPVELQMPVFSRFESDVEIHCKDANALVSDLEPVDLVYLDPPYNQHPYGSNYFMLNLIAGYTPPSAISRVSGIPKDWLRSEYNRRPKAIEALAHLIERVQAKFLLISFNSEGFVSRSEMMALLCSMGRVEVLETRYNAFRGSRNLAKREIHVKEYLYLLEK
jgi:adenine-specific DNA-methyltransferase